MKKILSLILALIMMLSTATMIFADEAIADETPVEVDETTSAYYEAVKFLVNYDIMHGKGDTLGVFDDVKRYEAALFFGRILTGWTDDSTWEDGILNSSEFTDLAGTAAEAFYGAISYVNQMGVIEGYGDGKFGPEDGIRYQDLLAMAVRALGYSEKYPWGCIQKAVELGLTDGITGVAYTDTLKREVVAQVIYNTLFAEKKAGSTLAKDVFDLDLAWTTVIITGTDKTTGVPAGYVSYAIVNADGTIGTETFYAPAEQFGLTGEHDDEKAYGALYNVTFETAAEYGLNNVIAAESLELETIDNMGLYDKKLAGWDIQTFLADYDIVTRYTTKTYLNAEPEIIISGVGLGMLDYQYVDTSDDYQYVVDWATGNIIKIDYANPTLTYDMAWIDMGGDTGVIQVPADKGFAGFEYDGEVYGLTKEQPLDWDYPYQRTFVVDETWEYLCVGSTIRAHCDDYNHHDLSDSKHNGSTCPDACCPDGLWCKKWSEEGKLTSYYCNGSHSDDNYEHAMWKKLLKEDEYTYSVAPTYTIEWYYNALLDTYFQFRDLDADPFDVIGGEYLVDEDGNVTVIYEDNIGIVYMDAETRANLAAIFNNTGVQYDKYTVLTLDEIESDAAKLNAYASLRVFDANKDSVADYGIYEEYRFGVVNTGMVACAECKAAKAGYIFTDLSNYAVGATKRVALEVVAETSCKHGTAWTEAEIVDGSYVIYGYNPATGETKIIKTIAGAKENDDDADYIGTGYLRAFDANKSTVVINGEEYQYDYTNLKGSMASIMAITHGYYEEDLEHYPDGFNDPDYSKFLAVAARYLRKLYNQVVEFVVVDDKIVHMELSGDSDAVIVVESYAGLHEDGTIVVWGYLVSNDATATKLQQFRIASYNSWLMGDWYNYSWNYTDVIEAAFTTGTVYEIKSYDEDLKAYNVEVLSSLTDNEYDYTKGGVWTELYYANANVNLMAKADVDDIDKEYKTPLLNEMYSRLTHGEDVTEPHHNYYRKMADTDKYVFIYDVNKSGTVAPIVTYTGKVTDTDWYVRGWRVNADVDGTYVFVIDGEWIADANRENKKGCINVKHTAGKPVAAEVNGFGAAADQKIGVVLFLEYGTKASYDAANGRDYLVGSSVYSAYVLDLVTGKTKEVTAYNGALRSPSITWSEVQGIEGDGWGTEIEWELGSEMLILYHEGEEIYCPAAGDPWQGALNMDHGPFDKVWAWEGDYAATENGVIFGAAGSLHDGYRDTAAYHFFCIDNIKGYLYKTVDNKIVNDEPLTAAEAGDILAAITDNGGSIATDDYVGESGYFAAKRDGSYQNEYQMIGNQYGGSNEDSIGINQYAINMRLTYDAFGVAYQGLSPFTLHRQKTRQVRVYALGDRENGMVQLECVGTNATGKINDKNVLTYRDGYWDGAKCAWEESDQNGRGTNNHFGEYSMVFFGDHADEHENCACHDEDHPYVEPENQSYKYAMIYNCDRSNATLSKEKDMSYALVYIYDDNADKTLQPADEDDILHGIN